MSRNPHLNELGEFLKARRAELSPSEVGLRGGQRRRVRGLRREEVALLAAISTEYYARIEQGRLQASTPLLNEIAQVLRLNEDQRTYLFDLAAKESVRTPISGDRQQADTQLQRILDNLTGTPAFVIGRRTDILAWNELAAALWTDFGRIPEQERVFIRLLFTEPWMRELYADWEEVTRLAIVQLRMESARYPGDRRLAALVEELSARDAQFRQWWAEHDVAARVKGTKKLRHPAVGELTLDWDTLTCATDPEQHIIVWTAAPGSPSYDGLRLLASWATDQKRTASDTVA
ncbi:helix-turn-helix domain-containing protein [Streptomyces sp. NBC_01728]|uniref:helix-turn-helix domain-containing protein n=1 Tax=unclassified Streptomyces TaxID=2593676 RepID=UPI00225A6D08|nr:MULTISPECIES: helix-turn-helix domain-containing protein [unclassified Streptomyces]MCX4461680.1 helix-turn-helix domain-containing protein [Streptomyces sp. NBC_01719]MCX4490589.1 helix-turn-helix domain-containing protein [Streptomyces sp. NBC_01728]